jgi:hypothetical protein
MNFATIERQLDNAFNTCFNSNYLFSDVVREWRAAMLFNQAQCAEDPSLVARHEEEAAYWSSLDHPDASLQYIICAENAAECRRAAAEGPSALRRIAAEVNALLAEG